MHLLNLLRFESTIDLRKLIAMAVLAGLSNAMVLALINAAAGRDPFDDNGMRLAMLFVVVLILYTISQRYLLTESAREIERILHRIRSRLIEAVRHCELRDVERIGRSRIYDGISKEIQSLAQSTNVLVIIAQMAILVVFTTLYLMTLSMTAFLLAAGFLTAATIIYLARAKKLQHALDDANEAESRLHELLIGVLDGFKEIKLNRKRSETLASDVIEASLVAADARTTLKVGNARSFLFTQNVFFLLLGTMVFIVAQASPPSLPHLRNRRREVHDGDPLRLRTDLRHRFGHPRLRGGRRLRRRSSWNSSGSNRTRDGNGAGSNAAEADAADLRSGKSRFATSSSPIQITASTRLRWARST